MAKSRTFSIYLSKKGSMPIPLKDGNALSEDFEATELPERNLLCSIAFRKNLVRRSFA
jgi:hypothetical protein